MALSYAQLYIYNGFDVLEDFFVLSEEGERLRQVEYLAAIKLQANWRGFKTRQNFIKMNSAVLSIQTVYRKYISAKKISQRKQQIELDARMRYLNSMATQIQRIWRGYWSRQSNFNYYLRKQYLKQLEVKMRETRSNLKRHVEYQKRLEIKRQRNYKREHLEALAGKKHHLVGTKAIPGVMKNVKKPVVPSLPTTPDEYDESEYFNETHKEPNLIVLPPLVRIPEYRLRNSNELRSWIDATVGKNPRGIKVKPPQTHIQNEFSCREELFPTKIDKLAQGPFLPKIVVKNKLIRPLNPTLRVETDFFDTKNYKREERQKEISLRVSERIFSTVKHVKHTPPGYIIEGGAYKLTQTFRDENKSKFISTKDFKNVTAPVPLFDDLANY